ncbi:MAG: murein biosynthesis integral membrane protein MurJ [Elusimicrobiota bacterium]
MENEDTNINSTRREEKQFGRRVSAFSSATMISRVLGYFRDSMVAAYFGGGIQTDAFYAAFKIPNLLRRFLGEGALTAAFVPVFSGILHKKGKEEANSFFNSLLMGQAILLSLIVIIGIIFAEPITKFVAFGFTRDPAKFDLAVNLTRLIWPFLLFISLAAIISAVLNSSGQFFIPAMAPSGLSIAEIAFISLMASQFENPIHGLAVAAVVGGGIHFLWLIPGLYKQGYHLKLVQPFKHSEVKSVFLLMVPTIIGLGADQINSFVDQFCASFLGDGSISALYNSNRIMQLPLAIFGVAVSSVSLPALSKAATQENWTEFKRLLSFSIRIANFILIPSVIGLIVIGFPITQLLFERGKFTFENSVMTYRALAPYVLGLPAFSMAKILATSFYSRKDTKTPVKIAFISMLINVVLNVLLMHKLQVSGLALATAVAAWVQVILLFFILRNKMGRIDGKAISKSFFFGIFAGLCMAVICYGLCFHLLLHWSLVLRVFTSIAAGSFFYFLIAKLLKVKELDFFLDLFLRKKT